MQDSKQILVNFVNFSETVTQKCLCFKKMLYKNTPQKIVLLAK